jgi:hypothetical protein
MRRGEREIQLTANTSNPARERLTLIRLFEELRALGYEGGYDAVRRYARSCSREHASQMADADVPLLIVTPLIFSAEASSDRHAAVHLADDHAGQIPSSIWSAGSVGVFTGPPISAPALV